MEGLRGRNREEAEDCRGKRMGEKPDQRRPRARWGSKGRAVPLEKGLADGILETRMLNIYC